MSLDPLPSPTFDGADLRDRVDSATAAIAALGGGSGTDLTYTAATRVLASSTGADVTLPLVSSSDAGLAPAYPGNTTTFLRGDGTYAAPAAATQYWDMTVALGDETTAATTGTAKVTLRMPRAVTLTAVRLSCTTAPTGAAIIVDVNEGGTSIFSVNPQIAAGSTTSVGGATPGTLSDTALADNAVLTFDVDAVGSTVAGAGLKVTLIGTTP